VSKRIEDYALLGHARYGCRRLTPPDSNAGLLAEEYKTGAGRTIRNFPQALSHLALINPDLGLCDPIGRGG
jgi:GH15 family glucan-1,4-alpha-glucosidase